MTDFYGFTAIAVLYVAVFAVIVWALDRWNATLDNERSECYDDDCFPAPSEIEE